MHTGAQCTIVHDFYDFDDFQSSIFLSSGTNKQVRCRLTKLTSKFSTSLEWKHVSTRWKIVIDTHVVMCHVVDMYTKKLSGCIHNNCLENQLRHQYAYVKG